VTDAAVDGFIIVKTMGMLVGWLLITYGLVLWGSRRFTRHPCAYAFMFVTSGFALILVANRVVFRDFFTTLLFESLGYLVFGALGTVVFAYLIARSVFAQLGIDPGDLAPDGGPVLGDDSDSDSDLDLDLDDQNRNYP